MATVSTIFVVAWTKTWPRKKSYKHSSKNIISSNAAFNIKMEKNFTFFQLLMKFAAGGSVALTRILAAQKKTNNEMRGGLYFNSHTCHISLLEERHKWKCLQHKTTFLNYTRIWTFQTSLTSTLNEACANCTCTQYTPRNSNFSFERISYTYTLNWKQERYNLKKKKKKNTICNEMLILERIPMRSSLKWLNIDVAYKFSEVVNAQKDDYVPAINI